MRVNSLNEANAGANALSGNVQVQASTSESLSNDIWGWKRHKGIVYANSHNDEMQGDRAFTYALSLGLAAIEADVWLVPASSLPGSENDSGSVLLVGHEDKDLRNARTLKKIYLDPIWDLLERENEGNDGSQGWKGIFTDRGVPDQTLLLLIDTKNEVDDTFEELRRLLTPFRERGYLSHFDRTSPNANITDGKLTLGPLTVIGTGDTPINSVLGENPRYIFKDAPLTKLDEPILFPDPATGNLTQVDWHPSFAPMASAKLSIASHVSYITSSAIFLPIRHAIRFAFSDPNLLDNADPPKFVREAHARGIESRWWGVARHPKLLRWALWGYVKDIGTDWLNADDLAEVAEFSRKRSENDRICI
ncbi:Altered inheritance of mitochondria protein 6 [Naganishia albida]|nr:Altered inheritance of mitochondria protein 6 [Naganishia albida]